MAATYDVQEITQDVFYEPGKPSGPGYKVTYVTKPSGIVGAVVLPSTMFSAAEVDRVVTAGAAALEAVKAL